MNPSYWTRDVARCAGLGAVAGGLEAVGLSAGLSAPLGVVGFALLGAACVGGMATVGAVVAALASPVVRRARAGEPDERIGATVMSVAGGLLCGWYLWGACLTLVEQGRPLTAAVFAILPLPFSFIVGFNARYWLRRSRRGDVQLPWLPVAVAVAAALVGIGMVVHTVRDTGGRGALAGDPSVVWVTVGDLGLAEDGSDWLRDVPDTVRFEEAITPVHSVRAASAALLTGLHPLRAGVVNDATPLPRGHRTIADVFADEGYATAAFLGQSALDQSSGLDQGFHVYDDRMGSLGGIANASWLHRLGLHRGTRLGTDVVASFAQWHGSHATVPHFAWVHVDAADAQGVIADVLDRVQQGDAADSTIVVAVGLTRAGTAGVSTPEVRVPFVVWAPDQRLEKRVVTSQVRVYDAGPTSLEFTQLDNLPVTEGIPLLGYGRGQRNASLPVVTLAPGRIGLRSGGVAYEQDLQGGAQRIFNLERDPTEDVSEQQAEALERARAMLAPEVSSYRELLGVQP